MFTYFTRVPTVPLSGGTSQKQSGLLLAFCYTWCRQRTEGRAVLVPVRTWLPAWGPEPGSRVMTLLVLLHLRRGRPATRPLQCPSSHLRPSCLMCDNLGCGGSPPSRGMSVPGQNGQTLTGNGFLPEKRTDLGNSHTAPPHPASSLHPSQRPISSWLLSWPFSRRPELPP